MNGFKQRLLGLCLPPCLLFMLDCILTLQGQSFQYWAGDYSSVNEGSPTFNHLLHIHPSAFLAGMTIWALVFVGIIILMPDTLALICSIAVALGHTVGAASWLILRYHHGYQFCNGLFLIVAIILGVGIRWGWRAVPEQKYRLTLLSPIIRWFLVALLVCVAAYLFLLPRMP